MENKETTHAFIAANRHRRVEELALELSKRQDLDANFVLRQIEGWQRLREKVPSWARGENLIYPPRIALEQCSGEPAARYKASVVKRLQAEGRLSRSGMVDLTGGMGVDFSFLAPLFHRATYVEQRAELVAAAHHNFPLLQVGKATLVEGDGTEFLKTMEATDLLFLDPARRDDTGRKTVLMEDCTPDVTALLPLLLRKCSLLMLKLSPMLHLRQAVDALGCVAEAHVFSAGGECKDLLLVCREGYIDETTFFCANERGVFSFTARSEAESVCPTTENIEGYLYEPDPAVMKAGAYKTIGQRYGLNKLHPNTHLYCAPRLHADFPGRVFHIERTVNFSKKELRDISALGRANLTIRNFPGTVDELRKRLKLKEGGDTYLFAATHADNRKVLIVCQRQ